MTGPSYSNIVQCHNKRDSLGSNQPLEAFHTQNLRRIVICQTPSDLHNISINLPLHQHHIRFIFWRWHQRLWRCHTLISKGARARTSQGISRPWVRRRARGSRSLNSLDIFCGLISCHIRIPRERPIRLLSDDNPNCLARGESADDTSDTSREETAT